MKIVITGVTGAIGTALVNLFVQNNVEVLLLVNPKSKRNNIQDNTLVKVKECSIEDYPNAQFEELYSAYDAFYHLAWAGTFGDSRNDVALQEKNVEYSLEAVRLAKRLGCKRFIGVGSQAEYGRKDIPLTSELYCDPENEYGKAKLKAGNKTRELAHELGMEHVWVRVLSVYGPNDGPNTMVMSTISKLNNGEIPKFTPSEQIWDYLYCGDAAEALKLIAEKGIDGKTYVLGSGEKKPLKEYIETIRDVVSPSAQLGIGELSYSDKQVMYLSADITELSNDTGWKPKTNFEEGIERIIGKTKE